MQTELTILLSTAAALGFIHTLLGPDHYVPFVAMAQAGGWSRAKTLTVTILCGVGHVASSVVLGVLGVALGWAVGSMESFESMRGEWAAWGLIAFGLVYTVWGIRRGIRNQPHAHVHSHPGHNDQKVLHSVIVHRDADTIGCRRVAVADGVLGAVGNASSVG